MESGLKQISAGLKYVVGSKKLVFSSDLCSGQRLQAKKCVFGENMTKVVFAEIKNGVRAFFSTWDRHSWILTKIWDQTVTALWKTSSQKFYVLPLTTDFSDVKVLTESKLKHIITFFKPLC